MKTQLILRRTVITLLAIFTVLLLVTGWGITEFRVVTPLTFGLLSKNVAFEIHNALIIPSIVLLAAHLTLMALGRRKKRQ
jgi:hypothetical protein